jgi:hypothetical protein
MSDTRLHSTDVILTIEGRTACSFCGHFIKEKKTSRNTTELQDWQSTDVMGLFCSEKCAVTAHNDRAYRSAYSFR